MVLLTILMVCQKGHLMICRSESHPDKNQDQFQCRSFNQNQTKKNFYHCYCPYCICDFDMCGNLCRNDTTHFTMSTKTSIDTIDTQTYVSRTK